MSVKWISVLLLLQMSCSFRSGNCGKVLVWPMEYSHWMNLKKILDELVERGHEVIVLRPSFSNFLHISNSSGLKSVTFPTSLDGNEVEKFITQWVDMWTHDVPKDTCLKYYPSLNRVFGQFSDLWLNLCKDAVMNKQVIAKLQESKFDVLVSDAIGPCGELIAELLQIPFVYSLRFGNGYTIEKYSGGLLFPPSYVPIILSGLSGQMTFMERVENMICLLYFDLWFESFPAKKWDPLYSEVLARPTTMVDLMSKAEMWLIRSYWDLEFPRPSLPNVEFVGGLHCKPAKPLPNEMEEFVQSSGEHGIVVFSLGSMVKNITEEKANIIASALAQIPQKVIWKFWGKKPDTLGPNTRLYNWVPQNDLLGHPKTKIFVTHGGTNGIYEAIHHGIPMVGIPLFADQHDNIAHMVAKGAAVALDFHTMSISDLLNALQTVLNNPLKWILNPIEDVLFAPIIFVPLLRILPGQLPLHFTEFTAGYKKNVMKLSTIHRDQPMKPLDRAVFWIEFVMRHKGAKHLRPLAYNLTWYQYHSLDVIAFLLVCVLTTVFLVKKLCLLVFRNILKMRKKRKNE